MDERSIRLWAAVSCFAAASIAGCATGGQRPAGEEVRAAASAAAERAGAPAETTRVTVSSVTLDRKGADGKHVLTVQAMPPSTGWSIEIRPLAVTAADTREFEVVGTGPQGSTGRAGIQVLTAEIQLESDVKHVVVYDEDDATVLEPR